MRAQTKVFIGIKVLIVGALIVHWQLVSMYLQQLNVPAQLIPVAVLVHLAAPIALAVIVRWHWRSGK